jgi:hypothetical protein
MRHRQITLLFAILAGCLPSLALSQSALLVDSINGDAIVDLSCRAPGVIDVLVVTRSRPPVIQAPDAQAGAGRPGAIQYTVDGQGPFLEDWQLRNGGLAPANREQLQAFVVRLATGRIMHLGTRGMQPFEFRLEKYAARFKSFAESCKVNR